MNKKVKILILEHDLDDIGLLQYELRKSELDCITQVAHTREEYQQTLISFEPDLVLSDFALPSFDGFSAFHIKQQTLPDASFILVSGSIGEEKAVELIKMGVTDYVLKDKLYQLMPKIKRALKEQAERKEKEEAERQLREREQQLQKILNLSLDVICTLDRQGRFVSINAACQVVLGYSAQELIGQYILDLVHEEDKQKTSAAMLNLNQDTNLVNFDNRFIRKDGAVVCLLWSMHWDASQQLGYSIARDATEVKKATEKIQNNEKRFRALLQNSHEGLSLLDADGTVIERSLSAIRVLELPPEEHNRKFRWDFVYPEDQVLVKEAIRKIQDHPKEAVTIRHRILLPGDRTKWLETTLHNQLGDPLIGAIVINFRDITESKNSEIALAKSEAKYRNLFMLSPTPMWVYDVRTLYFLDVNQAAIDQYGYSKQEFLTMTLKDIRPEEEIEKLEAIAQMLKEARIPYHFISRLKKKNGELVDVDINNSFVDLGDRGARLAIVTDISERMKYIRAIKEQNLQLREIAWIQSHVVRAPLARMMGLINLIQDYPPEKVTTTNLLSLLSVSAQELDRIIREIVGKAEQVKSQPLLEEGSLNP